MAVSILSAADTCTTTAGSGMVTTWQLTGLTINYDGELVDTDGYQIVSSMTWQSLSALTRDLNGVLFTAAAVSVIGTCVETLDDEGIPLQQWDRDGGNAAMCHWMYFTALSNNSSISKDGTVGTNWGETRYLSKAEWGYGGANLTGATINTIGTALTSTNQGFALGTAGLTLFLNASVYTMSWYQPKWQASYATDSLRRYSGATHEATYVQGYCVAARAQSTVTHFGVTAADKAGNIGVVTLSGAAALAASAIALGTVSLAF